MQSAEEIIYKSLKVAGISWDEGPDVGGKFGPYIQSERINIFKEYALELVKAGKVYRCFCNKERLEKINKKIVDGELKYV